MTEDEEAWIEKMFEGIDDQGLESLVTEEMIEAGLRAFALQLTYPGTSEKEKIAAIYRAMRKLEPADKLPSTSAQEAMR